jgi:hypothetical protein
LHKARAEAVAFETRKNYLAQLASQTNLRVQNCIGKPALSAKFPDVKPKALSCVDLTYTVRCGANGEVFAHGTTRNWVGYSCMGIGEVVELPERCAASEMSARVVSVEACE